MSVWVSLHFRNIKNWILVIKNFVGLLKSPQSSSVILIFIYFFKFFAQNVVVLFISALSILQLSLLFSTSIDLKRRGWLQRNISLFYECIAHVIFFSLRLQIAYTLKVCPLGNKFMTLFHSQINLCSLYRKIPSWIEHCCSRIFGSKRKTKLFW